MDYQEQKKLSRMVADEVERDRIERANIRERNFMEFIMGVLIASSIIIFTFSIMKAILT